MECYLCCIISSSLFDHLNQLMEYLFFCNSGVIKSRKKKSNSSALLNIEIISYKTKYKSLKFRFFLAAKVSRIIFKEPNLKAFPTSTWNHCKKILFFFRGETQYISCSLFFCLEFSSGKIVYPTLPWQQQLYKPYANHFITAVVVSWVYFFFIFPYNRAPQWEL